MLRNIEKRIQRPTMTARPIRTIRISGMGPPFARHGLRLGSGGANIFQPRAKSRDSARGAAGRGRGREDQAGGAGATREAREASSEPSLSKLMGLVRWASKPDARA